MFENNSAPSLSKAERRAQRRDEIVRQARANRLRQQRRRLLFQILATVVAFAVVIGGTVAILVARDSGSDGPSAAPPGLTGDGGILVGDPDAPVIIQAVEDFSCPHCAAFEEASGDLLAQYEAGRDVAVEYRGIAFLDRTSSTAYSTRALNASACVLDAGTEAWKKFHDALFDNQPAEGGAGLPDSTLINLAHQAGATASSVDTCIEDQTYKAWTKSSTQAAVADGISSTPTVRVNGSTIAEVDLAGLQAAVKAASGS